MNAISNSKLTRVSVTCLKETLFNQKILNWIESQRSGKKISNAHKVFKGMLFNRTIQDDVYIQGIPLFQGTNNTKTNNERNNIPDAG